MESPNISINFQDVAITTPSGDVIASEALRKIAATHLWKSAPTIPLYNASLKLHEGESVELNREEVLILMQIFKPRQHDGKWVNGWALPFAMFAMLGYLEKCLSSMEVKV